jgi:hypothetical protein
MSEQYTEDDLLRANIQMEKKHAEADFANYNLDIEPEAHYNNYGTRGVVDLLIEEKHQMHKSYNLIEMKSAAALDQATGANEIIRQFNRMRQYFFKDDDRDPGAYHSYCLEFLPSPETLNHLSENAVAYRSAVNANVGLPGKKENSERVSVCMRLPDPTGAPPLQINDDDVVPYTFDDPQTIRRYLNSIDYDWCDEFLKLLF